MTGFYNDGNRRLQDAFDTRRLADRLESVTLRDAIDADDRAFIESMDMFFLATADEQGRPDCSYKGGEPGFVRVLDGVYSHPLAYWAVTRDEGPRNPVVAEALSAIREQIASAVDVVVQITRLRDGSRRVTHVTEVQGMEGETVTLQDAFLFDYSAGVDAHGKFLGKPVPTGVRPRFTDKFDDLGIRLSPRVFGAPEPAVGRGW